jgi:hypothetical protein
MTPSEELVFRLCRRSFLSLWSYANPLKSQGKELCDALVVCAPDVIIFSVKEVRPRASGDVETDWARWTRRAIEESAAQVYGAERWLGTATHVITKEGTQGLALPDLAVRRVHRVAVALGSDGMIPIASQDFGNGYVHVFEEGALDVLMRELDTISDFADYLRAKEALLETTMVIVEGGEENLLAMYLRAGRRFEHTPDQLLVEGNLWEHLQRDGTFQAKKRANEASRPFDELIETFGREALAGTLEPGSMLTETEQLLRIMAREDRFNRRILGKSFNEFVDKAAEQDAGLARMGLSRSGVVYVFLALSRDFPREQRTKDLGLRCFVARGLNPSATTVVGIATERYEGKPGFSLDGCLLHLPTWTAAHQSQLLAIQKDLGYFVNAQERRTREDEYPSA